MDEFEVEVQFENEHGEFVSAYQADVLAQDLGDALYRTLMFRSGYDPSRVDVAMTAALSSGARHRSDAQAGSFVFMGYVLGGDIG